MQRSFTTSPRERRLPTTLIITILATLLTLLAGCDTSSSPAGALADNQRILASCDQAHSPASWIGIDGTGSSASKDIVKERMTAIEAIVRETAVCAGYLRVIVFSSSSTATVTLFDDSLRQPGATDIARLRRVPGAVTATMTTVRKVYESAATNLDQGASDITAQYRLAGEWLRQLGGAHALHLYLLTDGFQTTGVNLTARALAPQQAAALAERPAVPRLAGAKIVVAGLGRVAGRPPRSNMVEGLVAYYDALCHRMAAASCVSVSTYDEASR